MTASAAPGSVPGGSIAERNRELEDFLDNLAEPLHQVGRDGTVVWANQAELAMLGYAADEYIGHNIAEFHVDPDIARDFLARLVAGESLHKRPARLRCKDGSIKDVLVSSSGRFVDGEYVTSRCITRDVTRDRVAAIAQAQLAAIIDSSEDAILSKDLSGIVMSWNRAAEKLLGYRAEEMIGQPILKIIPAELQHEEVHILSKIRAGERIEHFQTQRLRKDGRRIEVSLSISPVRDPSGTIVGASKILRDVTELRSARRERGLLAAIVQSSDDAIIAKDLGGIVVSWNPAAERLYGFSAAEMLGQSIYRVIPKELHAEEELILKRIRAGERVDHYETIRLRKDGRLVEVSLTVSPVRDAAGMVIGASKIARDITPQREAQRKKDQFLAVLAHELRNPLAPIRNALQLMKTKQLPEDRIDHVMEIADRQMQQMTRLLEDLLDVARLTTGRVELHRQSVDIAALARDTVETMRPVMEARKLRFTWSIPSQPVCMFADAVRISQMIGNLLTNASKYTDAGGTVDMRLECDAESCVIRVLDTGIGFSEQMRERLFTLFSQDEAAVHRTSGGLGIGLALVREFAERHGGSVAAFSAGPMRGSEFVVRLPLGHLPCPEPANAATATARR